MKASTLYLKVQQIELACSFEYATVRNSRFGRNAGLAKDMELDLERRGAIFEDSPGDR